jgi:aspartyl-tRNA(Asn)/glutamyl-tRNA(Gln) amidotransferase subunit B
MRSKEEAHDYRYFPEPDLGSLEIDEAWMAEASRELPELPRARRARFVSQYGLPLSDAETLTSARELADYFEETAKDVPPRLAANWVTGEVLRWMKESKVSAEDARSFAVDPKRLTGLLLLVERAEVSAASAKEVLAEMVTSSEDAPAIVRRKGLAIVRDTESISRAVAETLKNNAEQVNQYRNGKTQTFGFFVGQVMKQMGGRADPAAVREVLTRELEKKRES